MENQEQVQPSKTQSQRPGFNTNKKEDEKLEGSAYAGGDTSLEADSNLDDQPAVPTNLKPLEEGDRDDQLHTMSDDEKVDEYIDESFPASDPPGNY